MTHFLLRVFLKNHTDAESPEARAALGSAAGITGICCNLLLFLGKLLAGLAAGSVAMTADAFNNLSDAASSIITLLGFRLARRPADREHPFGHARYEYLAGLVVSALILVMGLELAKTALGKILHPQPLSVSALSIAILLGSIGVKLWMSAFYKTVGSRIHSQTLAAAALDSRSDVLATSGVLLAFLLDRFDGWNTDGIIGLAVSICILWSGIQAMRNTLSPLLGTQPDQKTVSQIEELVLSHENILGTHDLLIHDYGPGQCFATIHAEVNAREDPLRSHDLLEDIEQDALNQLNVHLVIHSDPVLTDDPTWERLRSRTAEAAASVDPRLTIHDFHLSEQSGQLQAVFDLAVPYDFPMDREQLTQALEAAMAARHVPVPAVITFDET